MRKPKIEFSNFQKIPVLNDNDVAIVEIKAVIILSSSEGLG